MKGGHIYDGSMPATKDGFIVIYRKRVVISFNESNQWIDWIFLEGIIIRSYWVFEWSWERWKRPIETIFIINYLWCWCVWYGIVRILFPLRHLFQLLSSKLWWNENNATKGKAFDEKDLLPEPSWYTNQHFAKAQRQEVQLRTKYCLD